MIIIWIFPWNLYLKTDEASVLTLFSIKDLKQDSWKLWWSHHLSYSYTFNSSHKRSCLIEISYYLKYCQLLREYVDCIILKSLPNSYTVFHIFRQVLFWAGNQVNHQNFEKNDTSYEIQGCFHFKKQTFFFLKKKIQNGRLKKNHFPAPPILNNFSQKFHGLVFWLVGLIDAKGIGVAQPLWLWSCPT